MDILHEIGLAEKAGSGSDKIFTDLLKKGKSLPEPDETENSVIFRIKSNVVSEKLIELSLLYENQIGKPMKLDELLVLSEVVNNKRVKVADLANIPNMGASRLQSVIEKPCSLEFMRHRARLQDYRIYCMSANKKIWMTRLTMSNQKTRESQTKRGHLTLFGFHTYYQ